MFQVIFGDDEHTAAEAPYGRMLKARKWLLLSSGLATLHAYHLIDLAKLQKILGDIAKIPSWMLTLALTTGLAYLLAQAVLILIQLRETYERALAARLPDTPEAIEARKRLGSVLSRMLTLDRDADEGHLDKHSYVRRMEDLRREEEEVRKSLDAEREASLRQNPGFMRAEIIIDWLRLAPPVAVALYAFAHLVFVHPGFGEPKSPSPAMSPAAPRLQP